MQIALENVSDLNRRDLVADRIVALLIIQFVARRHQRRDRMGGNILNGILSLLKTLVPGLAGYEIKFHNTALWRLLAADDLEQRRLATSVGATDYPMFVIIDCPAEAVEYFLA